MWPEHVVVGFREKPTDEQLQEISGIINKTLETLGVEKYDLKKQNHGYFYYSFVLQILKESKMSPDLTLRVNLPGLERKLMSTYDHVMYVGQRQEGGIETLAAKSRILGSEYQRLA